ncbi:MAG: hypothetical protein GF392_04390 [Candidatus Omnitrophica bacterium]|nr:hypothetical protein [Candidatus Omnitrophota bacterium]
MIRAISNSSANGHWGRNKVPFRARRSLLRALFLSLLVLPVTGSGQTPQNPDMNSEVLRHLNIYEETTTRLDEIFSDFSLGHLTADSALEKTILLKHEYSKLARPLPPGLENFHDLTMRLLSRIENYFITFKQWDREDPSLNLKIAETRYELHKELVRIQYEML